MKKILVLGLMGLIGLMGVAEAQTQNDKPSKRERKKNLVVKEWNTRAGSTVPYLDNMVTYDEQGRKIEEIEYASYGQKKRTTYSYEGNSTKCKEQVEYNDDGTKKRQLNYKPNGKLETTKTFEYSYK